MHFSLMGINMMIGLHLPAVDDAESEGKINLGMDQLMQDVKLCDFCSAYNQEIIFNNSF